MSAQHEHLRCSSKHSPHMVAACAERLLACSSSMPSDDDPHFSGPAVGCAGQRPAAATPKPGKPIHKLPGLQYAIPNVDTRGCLSSCQGRQGLRKLIGGLRSLTADGTPPVVHEVAEKFPAGGHLVGFDALLLAHPVDNRQRSARSCTQVSCKQEPPAHTWSYGQAY